MKIAINLDNKKIFYFFVGLSLIFIALGLFADKAEFFRIGGSLFFATIAVKVSSKIFSWLWRISLGVFAFVLVFLAITFIFPAFHFPSILGLKQLNFLKLKICPDTCSFYAKKIIVPLEPEEDYDSLTGVKIIKLTHGSFDYYEPTHFDKRTGKLEIFTAKDGKDLFGYIDYLKDFKMVLYDTYPYQMKMMEFSPNGQEIYGYAELVDEPPLYSERFNPYFVKINLEDGATQILRLSYKISELPQGFYEKIAKSKNRKEAENDWLIEGNKLTPDRVVLFHINPQGTFAGFNAHEGIGVVDIENMKSWILEMGESRGAFYDEKRIIFGGIPVSQKIEKIINIFTKKDETPEWMHDDPFLSGKGLISDCDHGNGWWEEGKLKKIACPYGWYKEDNIMKKGFFIYDLGTKEKQILAREGDAECCGTASSFSADGRLVAGVNDDYEIFIFDTLTGKKAKLFSHKFKGKFIKPLDFPTCMKCYRGRASISPNGKYLAFEAIPFGSEKEMEDFKEKSVTCWGLEYGFERPGKCETDECVREYCSKNQNQKECFEIRAESSRKMKECKEFINQFEKRKSLFLVEINEEL